MNAATQSDLPEARCGAFNMAVDHVLLERVQRGGPPALRFYRWQPACLSLGRNQPACTQQSRLEALAPDIVRRPTGGLAVLHDQELTYSVAAPASTFGSPRAAYEAINQALLRGLLSLGVPAAALTADSTRSSFRGAGSCFAGSAPGEVGVDGRKMVGSAQRYERRTILQHGSILLDGDQSMADEWFGWSAHAESSTALGRVLPRLPDQRELLDVFGRSFEQQLGIALAPACLGSIELARVHELTDHYRSAAWTWRV
ncbi:MAG: lipoate--protein ligase family protein [Longimicrobiales bacterium]